MYKSFVTFLGLTLLGCGAASSTAGPEGAAPSGGSDSAGVSLDAGEATQDVSPQESDTEKTATSTSAGPQEPGMSSPEPPPEGPLEATETECLLRITIMSDKQDPIPGVIVTVENSAGKRFVSRESDAQGRLELLVPNGDTYVARFVSLDENEITKEIPIPAKPNITADFELTYTPPHTRSFVLKGIYFDTAKWNLKKESYPNLTNLIEYMTLKKSAVIRLEGHTDNVGDDKKNQILSQKRADAVRKYLINKGISPQRVEAVGYGETMPIASNDTEEGRKINRRTVVTILQE